MNNGYGLFGPMPPQQNNKKQQQKTDQQTCQFGSSLFDQSSNRGEEILDSE